MQLAVNFVEGFKQAQARSLCMVAAMAVGLGVSYIFPGEEGSVIALTKLSWLVPIWFFLSIAAYWIVFKKEVQVTADTFSLSKIGLSANVRLKDITNFSYTDNYIYLDFNSNLFTRKLSLRGFSLDERKRIVEQIQQNINPHSVL